MIIKIIIIKEGDIKITLWHRDHHVQYQSMDQIMTTIIAIVITLALIIMMIILASTTIMNIAIMFINKK